MTTATIGERAGATYSGTEDAVLISGLPNSNFPTEAGSGAAPFLLRFTGLSNITGPVTVTDAFINLKVTTGSAGSANYGVKRVLRAWVENQATWTDYITSTAWATAGCGADGTDRVAADSCIIAYPGGFDTSDIASTNNTQLITDVENIINGSATNNGWLCLVDVAVGLPASGTAADRPLLTVTYTSGGATQVPIYYSRKIFFPV
jgi:hypothetical protein